MMSYVEVDYWFPWIPIKTIVFSTLICFDQSSFYSRVQTILRKSWQHPSPLDKLPNITPLLLRQLTFIIQQERLHIFPEHEPIKLWWLFHPFQLLKICFLRLSVTRHSKPFQPFNLLNYCCKVKPSNNFHHNLWALDKRCSKTSNSSKPGMQGAHELLNNFYNLIQQQNSYFLVEGLLKIEENM